MSEMSQADNVGGQPTDNQTEDVDFASLLAGHLSPPRRYRQGQQVSGPVVKIGEDVVFVNLDGKREGVIDLIEFKDDDGNLKIQVGDTVEAFVVSTGSEEETVRLSRALGRGAAQMDRLQDAQVAGIPVEGRIGARNKGGFDVFFGSVRAFLPLSHLDTRRVPDDELDGWVGQTHLFKVQRIKGKDVVVSRAALLKEEGERKLASIKDQLKEGGVVTGRVRSIRDFGAFVEIAPGVDGLLHVSEMSWARVSNPRDVLSEGQEITVHVLKYDRDSGKLSLGLKQLGSDPWVGVEERFKVGDQVTGRVVRMTTFGAFVELAPGLDGLIHVSNMSWHKRVNKPSDVVAIGDEVQAQILSVEPANRRIGLGLKQISSDPWASAEDKYGVGAEATGKVEKVETFGVFLTLEPGVTGLIPNAEMGTKHGTDHKKDFPPGTELKVVVLELDTKDRKLRLSRKAVGDNAERADFKQYTDKSKAAPQTFGTMAAALSGLKLK